MNSISKNHDSLPAVSCMCLTFGRVNELEEAIECFLRQDYQGEKELIVLNDLNKQNLIFDHPQVRVINLENRCTSVGSKRNLCAELSKHELLFVWDDDDIYMPHRISHSVKRIQENKLAFYKPDKGYYWNNGRLTNLKHNLFHSQSCYKKSLFNEIGGYPDMGSGEDLDFEQKIQQLGHNTYHAEISKFYFYFYRWNGVSSYHLSGFGVDNVETQVSGETRVSRAVQHGIFKGDIPTGDIELKPTLKYNYKRQKFWFDAKQKLKTYFS